MYRIIFLLLLRRPTSSTLPDTLFPYTTLSRSNGVTPRRWLYNCNPPLRGLLREAIGDGWVTDLEQLQRLAPLADDAGFRERFDAAKDANKACLVDYLDRTLGVTVDREALFDIQIKRIHEYKRQLLSILHAAALWNEIRRNPEAECVPQIGRAHV